MSQVRKLKNGGVPKYKYGSIIIDGINYGNSEDTYRQFANYLSVQDPRQGAAHDAMLQQLQRGEDLVLGVDNSSNTYDPRLTEAQAGQRSTVKKVFDDIFDTTSNRNSEANYTARQFRPIEAPKTKNRHTNNAVNFVFRGELNKYDKDDFANKGINDRFNSYLDWLSNENWDEDNEFTSALSDQQKANLRAWYRGLEGATPEAKRAAALAEWNANLGKVIAAEGGYENVDDAARGFFSNFNIGNASAANSSGSDSGSNSDAKLTEKQAREKLKKAGYDEDLYKLIGDDFEIGDDGTLKSKSGAFDFGFGNAYFNDDFYKTAFGAEGKYNPLHGLTIYNGALYKKDNATLANILNAEDSYNARYKKGDFTGADQIVRTRWTEGERENPQTLNPDDYSKFIPQGMQFSNITGLVTLTDGSLQNGQQIIQYIDPNDYTLDGPYTHYNYKYALLDDRGTKLRDLTRDQLQNVVGGVKAGELNTYKKTNIGTGKYANKYYEDITGKNGQASGIRIYRDINNPNSDVILHVDGLNGSAEGKDIALPKEVAEILMRDQSWINKVVGNPQARMNFTNALSSLVQDRSGRRIRGILGATGLLGPYGLFTGTGDLDYNYSKLKVLGLGREQTKALQKALRNATVGNKWERRENYLLDTPEFRNGGKVAYITKLAGGGFAGGAMGSNGVTERRVDTKVSDPRNASGLSEIGGQNWTDADSKDLFALTADLASLGLAFAPGANVASTATGVASSLARYSADKDRGTKGAGTQLALNLGMDAATLLPFLGGAAKGAKIVKSIKKALPLIIKAASVYGLSAAVVTSAKKIANGEKFTVRDVSNVVNGLTAGVGLAKSGGFGRGSKKTTGFEEVNLKSKDGSKTLNLTGEEVAKIDNADELFNALQAKSGLTKEQFAEQFDVNSLLTSKTRWTPGWKPKNWKNTTTEKFFEPTKTFGREAIEANGNRLHDWWYRIGTYNQLYNKKLTNEGVGGAPNKKDYMTKTKGGEKSVRQVFTGKWKPGEFKKTGTFETYYAGPEDSGTIIGTSGVRYMDPVMRNQNVTRGNGFVFNRHGFKRATAHHNNLQNYYNRIAVAHPNIILPLQLSGYQYEPLSGTYLDPMYYKKGGTIKAEAGAITPKEQEWIDSQFKNSLITNISNSNLSDDPKHQYIHSLLHQSSQTPKYGDYGIDTSNWIANIYQKLQGTGEYFAKKIGRQNVHDITERGILNADRNRPNVILQHASRHDPASEAAYQKLDQLNSNPNINKTADQHAYIAGLLGNQAQILNAVDNVNRQASERNRQFDLADNEVANKQALMDNEVARENQDLRAEREMQLASNDASLKMQDAMSLANLIRENRAITEQELAKAKQYAFTNAAKAIDDKYERAWNGTLGNYYNTWMNLDPSVRDQYSDINDWLQRASENKGVWNRYQAAWDLNQKALNDERTRLYAKYNLSPTAQTLYRQRYGTSYKKGGRVGRNRYKNEPEEDVWIDQNRAVHKQVAKLNDNIIKIFLKSLK